MKTKQVTFQPGDTIVREDEPGYVDGFCTVYLIESGTAKVVRKGEEVAELGAGEIAGEMSLLLGEPRSATVFVSGESRVPVTATQITVKSSDEFAMMMPEDAARSWAQSAERGRRMLIENVALKSRVKELENELKHARGLVARCRCSYGGVEERG